MSTFFEVKRTIAVPKEQAYNHLLDLDGAQNWMKGLVGIEKLEEGPLQVGSQWLETRKMYGAKATEHFEVVELDPGNKIVLRCDGTKGTTGKGVFVFTYLITSSGEQSEVTLHGEIKGLTGITKWFEKMMAGTFKKACAKDLDALKSYLEKG